MTRHFEDRKKQGKTPRVAAAESAITQPILAPAAPASRQSVSRVGVHDTGPAMVVRVYV